MKYWDATRRRRPASEERELSRVTQIMVEQKAAIAVEVAQWYHQHKDDVVSLD